MNPFRLWRRLGEAPSPRPGDAVEAALGPRLAGFEHVGDLRWVGASDQGIRNLFQFQAMKGGVYAARWGFSIDFVPLFRGGALKPKASAGKADFDLCIDPLDVSTDLPRWCSFGAGASEKQIARVARASFDAAAADFDDVADLRDICTLFEKRSTAAFSRFSPSNYVQTDLAWGLAQIATSNAAAGRDRIRQFCDTFGVDRNARAIEIAEAEAARWCVGHRK